MKIIPFPNSGAVFDEQWHTELEAALCGHASGSVADVWRELRSDVRALAPPMDPGFEERLRARIAARSSRPLRRLSSSGEATAETTDRLQPVADPVSVGRSYAGLRRPRASRPARLGLLVPIAAVVALLVILAPWKLATHQAPRVPEAASPSNSRATLSSPSVGAGGAAATASGPAITQGRVQQLTASIGLSTAPGNVQSVASRVAQLAVSDGGFVQSSHVQTQRRGTSEATLTLHLPSAELGAAITSLEALAPVREESQSSQDITGSYQAARRALADAVAERRALLRALSRATREGQIDSLREQLSQARGSIGRARAAVHDLSQQANTTELEVTVTGEAHEGSEGSSLRRGLSDAERILTVSLVVVLIVLATIIPVAVAVATLIGTHRVWRRYRREHALDTR
jgi:Domain of unknown function (DUF4349)